MSYFEDASLVLIPSAQKLSKIYSVKPTDGSGDMAFTRSNDTATRVGPDGLIEKVRTNLATNSEAFNLWLASDSTTTANAAANPLNGATTADKVIATATTAEHNIYYSVTSAVGEITTSVYAKADGYNFLYLRNTSSSGGGVWFNLSTGAIATQQSGRVGTITSVGNGWYRCSVTWNQPTAGTNQFIIVGPAPSDNTATYLGDGTSGVLLFGAQMEYGVMTDYIATTTAAVSVGPVANVPRLDYLNSSCPRLLLEPQRTNLALFSEQFDNGHWDKFNVTISANNATAPDGTLSADKIVADTNNSNHATYKQTLISSGSATISVYAKAAGYNFIFISDTLSLDRGAYFNLSNGTLGTVGSSATASIQNAGNGWYRCFITFTAVSGSGVGFDLASANGTLVSTGDNVNGVLLWGAQVEAGAYATSYIPTLGAAVTRGADSCSKTGISSLIGQTEGTLFLDITLGSNPVTLRLFSVSAPTWTDHSIRIDWNAIVSDSKIVCEGVYAGAQTFLLNSINPYTNGTRLKIAIAYKSNDCVMYINGVQQSTDTTTGTIPACSVVALNELYGFGSGSFEKNDFNQTLLFKTRLTNAQLAELTTI